MKLEFRTFSIILIVFLAIVSPILPYAIITGTTLNLNDKFWWTLFFGILITITVLLIWKTLLTQLLKIQLVDNILYSKNLITKKKQQINLVEISEIKESIWHNIIVIVGKKNRIRINTDFYSNVAELIERIKTVANN